MKPNIFIACPAFGNTIRTETTGSLMAVCQAFVERGIYGGFGSMSYPDIVDLRNVFLTIWYDKLSKSTHMLTVDADMRFGHQLVLDMLSLNKPVVGVAYPKKTYPLEHVFRYEGPPVILGGAMRVDGVGGGVLLVRRDAIDTMIVERQVEITDDLDRHVCRDLLAQYHCERIIRAFEPVEAEHGRLSEDFSFCERWRRSGGEVWADITHEVGHIGAHEYKGSFAETMRLRQEKAA